MYQSDKVDESQRHQICVFSYANITLENNVIHANSTSSSNEQQMSILLILSEFGHSSTFLFFIF